MKPLRLTQKIASGLRSSSTIDQLQTRILD